MSEHRNGTVEDFTSVEVRPVVGEVRATRMFEWNDDLGVLTGWYFSQPVLDGVNVARCLSLAEHSHLAPAPGCSCGFWVYDHPGVWYGGIKSDSNVPAVVEVHGRAVVGTRGLRAQKLRVLGIVPPSSWGPQQHARFAANYPHAATFGTVQEMCAALPVEPLTRPHQPGPRWKVPPLVRRMAKGFLRTTLGTVGAVAGWLAVAVTISLFPEIGAAVAAVMTSNLAAAMALIVVSVLVTIWMVTHLATGVLDRRGRSTRASGSARAVLTHSGVGASLGRAQPLRQNRAAVVEGSGVRPDGVVFDDVSAETEPPALLQ